MKKTVRNIESYIPPQDMIITNDDTKLPILPAIGQYISIASVVKKFLETADNLSTAKAFLTEVKNEDSLILSHFCQGSLWKSIKSRFPGKFLSPLFLYFDDFNVGNTLRSHSSSSKIGGVYYTIPAFPPEFLSQLKNIFVASIFQSDAREKFGNEKIFAMLLNELSALEEEGLSINFGGEIIVVNIVSCLILGDNLGVHSLPGFIGGFNGKHPCTFCKISSYDIKHSMSLDPILCRNKDNYEIDLASHDPSGTGARKRCIFNRLISFYAIENTSCDLMHDAYLGFLRHDMALITRNVMKVGEISLNDVNQRIKNFSME